MKNQNLLILTAFAVTMGIAMSTTVNAQEATMYINKETLIDRITKVFKLNETEVNKVATDFRTEKQAERTKLLEEKLTQLVKDGKITNDQKTKILAKHKEMQENRPTFEEMQNMTKEERRAEKQARRAELEEWAQANGIDMQYLFMLGRGNKGYGMGGGKFMMGQDAE